MVSSCALHLTEMSESVDGRDITPLWDTDLVGAKVEYCSGLLSSEALVLDYIGNLGALSRYKTAQKYDQNVADEMRVKYHASMLKRLKNNYRFDSQDLYITNWTLSLDKYDEKLGGHLVLSDLGKKMILSERLNEEGMRHNSKINPKFFVDDYDLMVSSLYADIYGVNLRTVNGWDSNGNRVYQPQTAYLRGKLNVVVDNSIDTDKSVGMEFNERINRFVLKVTKEQSKRLIDQAISRGRNAEIMLSAAFDISKCEESGKDSILLGEIVEAKVFFLEFSKWNKSAGYDGWVAGDMISHWYPTD